MELERAGTRSGGHHSRNSYLRLYAASGPDYSKASQLLSAVADGLANGRMGLHMALLHTSEIFTSETYDSQAIARMRDSRARAIGAILDAVLIRGFSAGDLDNDRGKTIARSISEIKEHLTEEEESGFGVRFADVEEMLAARGHRHKR